MLLWRVLVLFSRVAFLGMEWFSEDLRPTMRNVAKGATPRRAILSIGGEDVSRLVFEVGVAT
jgi:hypothetical protein